MPPWPHFADDEIAAAESVLRSGRVNYWTGEEGRKFEEEFAASIGVRHAVAVANGTVAIELALEALDIGPGDDVILTCRTFIASASAVVMRGARPVLVDVDPDTENITAEAVAEAITPATRAIIAVHLWGWPCDMDAIMALAEDHRLCVIEDCAQAHGGQYKGRPLGSIGHVSAWSFCQDKILTTGGEGGMVAMNGEALWRRCWEFKDHGKSYAAVYERDHPPGFRWLHEKFGTNWRMTEMQSAIGRVILRKLPEWGNRRRRLSARLTDGLGGFAGLRIPPPPNDIVHARYKFSLFVRPKALAHDWDRDRIMNAVNDEGVVCRSGICPEIYRERAFRDSAYAVPKRLPVARALGETSLNLLVHPTLDREYIDDVIAAFEKVMALAHR